MGARSARRRRSGLRATTSRNETRTSPLGSSRRLGSTASRPTSRTSFTCSGGLSASLVEGLVMVTVVLLVRRAGYPHIEHRPGRRPVAPPRVDLGTTRGRARPGDDSGLGRRGAPSARTLAAHQMKDATELAVGVSSAGFELDRGRRRHLLRVAGSSSAPLNSSQSTNSQTPYQRTGCTPPARMQLAELLHRVGSAGTPSTPISVLASNDARASSHRRSRAGRTALALALPVMIETTPPAAAHRHSWSTNGSGCSRYPSTPWHSTAAKRRPCTASSAFSPSACRSVTRRWASAGSRWSRCSALSSIAGDGSSNVTS